MPKKPPQNHGARVKNIESVFFNDFHMNILNQEISFVVGMPTIHPVASITSSSMLCSSRTADTTPPVT